MQLPDCFDPLALDGIDLHALRMQTQAHISRLNHQLVHTTLAHLLRDTEGLEALEVESTTGKYEVHMGIGKGVKPVWADHATKAAKTQFKVAFQHLMERMLDPKTHQVFEALFKHVHSPALPRTPKATYGMRHILRLPKDQWQEYLRVALPAEIAAQLEAQGIASVLEGPASTPAEAHRRRL